MFRAELGALGEGVNAALARCFKLDGLAACDFDGDLAPRQAVPGVDGGCNMGWGGNEAPGGR